MRLQPLKFSPERLEDIAFGWRSDLPLRVKRYKIPLALAAAVPLRLTFEPREIFQTSLRKVLNTGELLVLVCWRASQSLLK
jgi:hypothetical protein